MTDARAIAGTFADIRTVKTRATVQMILEFPIEEGEKIIRLFGFPQAANPAQVAVARLRINPTIESEVVPDRKAQPTDFERPAEHTKPASDRLPRQWGELSLAQQAGIKCNEEAFWKFLSEKSVEDGREQLIDSAEKAATYVRMICGVHSRADLDKNAKSASRWRELESQYRLWFQVPA